MVIDANSSIVLTNTQVFSGLYSYWHITGLMEANAATYIDCTPTALGDFTGHAMFDALCSFTDYVFWKAKDHAGGQDLLRLYYDAVDGNKVKLECMSGDACDVQEVYEVDAVGISADTWYTYTVQWNLPQDVATGEIDVWWNGVHVVSDHAVQTQNIGWRDTDRVYEGIVTWHYIHCDQVGMWTDKKEDCECH